MTLQSSGAISLANVQTEFGGSNPISLSEYYGAASGVPTSGTISLSHFYGKSNAPSVQFISRSYGEGNSNAFIYTTVSANSGDIVMTFWMTTNTAADDPPTVSSGESFTQVIPYGYANDSNRSAGFVHYFIANGTGSRTITGHRSQSSNQDSAMYTYVIRGAGSPVIEGTAVYHVTNGSNISSQSISFGGNAVMALYSYVSAHDDGARTGIATNNGSAFNNHTTYTTDSTADMSLASGYFLAQGSSFNTPALSRSGSDSVSSGRLMVVKITGYA